MKKLADLITNWPFSLNFIPYCDCRLVFLGAYDDEEAAGHAYDLAAMKYWGQDTILNFPVTQTSDNFDYR